jgi:hypothetical protein
LTTTPITNSKNIFPLNLTPGKNKRKKENKRKKKKKKVNQ